MLNTLKSISAPILSLCLLMLGNGFFTTFMSLRMQIDGASSMLIGYLHSAYYLGFLVGSIKVEAMISRIRHTRAYAFFAALATCLILAQSLWENWFFWIFSRMLYGYCVAILYVVIESWFLISSPTHLRGKVLSTYMVGLYISLSLGQFFVDLMEITSEKPFIVVSILTCMSILPVTFTTSKIPHLQETHPKILGRIWKKTPFGFVSCITSGIIIGSIYALIPIFATHSHYSPSLLTSVTISGGFLLQWPLGYLSDLFDRRKVLLASSASILIPCVLLLIFHTNPITTYILCFLMGGLSFTLYPLAISHSCDQILPQNFTSAAGALLLTYSLGAIVGPSVAGKMMTFFPQQGLLLFVLLVSLANSCFGILTILSRESIPETLRKDYQPIPASTQVAYELDPRKDGYEDKT